MGDRHKRSSTGIGARADIVHYSYINDIVDGITCSLLKFAADTKLLRIVRTQDYCEELQKDLDRM